MKKKMPVVLTIAGSDSGGGAGIQADLKTFTALGTFGTTAITAITSQNLQGVRSIQPVRPEIVKDQIEAVCEGFPVSAVKTGMLFSADIIRVVAECIKKFRIARLVVDPVFAATSGAKLIEDEAITTLKDELFPLALVITPNMPEAEFLTGCKITNLMEMRGALRILIEDYPGSMFVLKGGHLTDAAIDLYGGCGLPFTELVAKLVPDINNHGSGCSFASAIAAFLARGFDIKTSLERSKHFISGALEKGLMLEENLALINHFWESTMAAE